MTKYVFKHLLLLFLLSFFISDIHSQSVEQKGNIFYQEALLSFKDKSYKNVLYYLDKSESLMGTSTPEIEALRAKTYAHLGDWDHAIQAIQACKQMNPAEDLKAEMDALRLTIDKDLSNLGDSGKIEKTQPEMDTNSDDDVDEEVFMVVENPPAFPGGNSALGAYLSNNLEYPANAQANGLQGKVYVSFVVGKEGQISEVKVVKSAGKELDAEAVRVVRMMPAWIPGTQRGKAVRVAYVLPIGFALN